MTTSTTQIPIDTKQIIDSHVHTFSLTTMQDVDCYGRLHQHLTTQDQGVMANNSTLPGAAFYRGFIKASTPTGTGNNITVYLDSAANIIAAIPGAKDGIGLIVCPPIMGQMT